MTLQGATLSITDLSPQSSMQTVARVDKLVMDEGLVSFLRDSHGEFAGLSIGELSGTGNFYFNISVAEANGNFVTIEQGTGNFGIAVVDSGREVASHKDLTVNLIHEKNGDAQFSLVQADGRIIQAVDGGTYMYTLHSEQDKDGLAGNVWYLAVPAKGTVMVMGMKTATKTEMGTKTGTEMATAAAAEMATGRFRRPPSDRCGS
ncbi:hypothetical protein CEW81_13995 [Kluyvera genomosp. 3]|uniref:Pertactin central region domain-containing protein n=1 Tax=Kluyvera genomosp. 3 TaxID=2774055 RepID=A0A248KJ54_9ENTR|nr:hypothetical protein CEW81_13995 [Kluyvera genomosp. 3]